MSKKVELNPLGMSKKDFKIEGGVITAKDGLWDKYLGEVISADKASVFLHAEEDYATSVTKVAGNIAIKELGKDDDLAKIKFVANLPGDDSEVCGTVYRKRSFGSKLSKSKTEHYGYTDTTIKHGTGEGVYHVQDYLADMAKKAFSDSKK